ncbi:MAG: hypothetical protein HC790_04400 [Acaryochloridaceae cyanobacterium CSU_3_4]|nr:hypothetical protein [Acaryochloridaceae cyanobacterium CSU_3_4]NJR53215.1 hypothetical protein [Acaryochloris sp. CRU_2_0]
MQRMTPEVPLFSGICLRWPVLTPSEQLVCLGIVLIPLWWLWGWSYLLLFLALGIGLQAIRQQKL